MRRLDTQTQGKFDENLARLITNAMQVVNSCEERSDNPVERAKQIIDVLEVLAVSVTRPTSEETEA